LLTARETTEGSTEVYLEVVAAAFGASLVLLSDMPIWLRNQAVAALRDDYHRIVKLGLGYPPHRGQLLDATAGGPLGPLWPADAPKW
jgi:hypothetical protein